MFSIKRRVYRSVVCGRKLIVFECRKSFIMHGRHVGISLVRRTGIRERGQGIDWRCARQIPKVCDRSPCVRTAWHAHLCTQRKLDGLFSRRRDGVVTATAGRHAVRRTGFSPSENRLDHFARLWFRTAIGWAAPELKSQTGRCRLNWTVSYIYVYVCTRA